MLHYVDWSMGIENAKELSVFIFSVIRCTMKKTALTWLLNVFKYLLIDAA